MNTKHHFYRKNFMAYLRQKKGIILILLLFFLICARIFYLYHISTDCSSFFAGSICFIIGSIAVGIDFSRFCQTRRKLQEAMQTITVSLETLPLARTPLEQDYQQLLELLHTEQNPHPRRKTAESKTSCRTTTPCGVHQIKVPIQAMRLLLAKEEKNSPLNLELFKIEQYVEMVLSYARLKSNSTDYVIRRLPLEDIVKPAVRKYAPMFIAKKISLEMDPMTATVLTDEKWAQFMIEQILSNSLKYTRTGSIHIYQEDPASLVIEDTGIGIDPADIPRLGERGFTGYNGRIDKKSTGIGLYLCKEISRRLSHTISIASRTRATSTPVTIDFETRTLLAE